MRKIHRQSRLEVIGMHMYYIMCLNWLTYHVQVGCVKTSDEEYNVLTDPLNVFVQRAEVFR